MGEGGTGARESACTVRYHIRVTVEVLCSEIQCVIVNVYMGSPLNIVYRMTNRHD